jgi:hemolysin activation/secretion protein
VDVEGGFADRSEAATRLFAPLQNHRVSVAELYQAAARLEQAYAKAGYLLVRVAVPRQSIVDGGAFRVVVVDGFIERIDDSAVPKNIRQPVHEIMIRLVGRRRLKATRLEADLARAGAVFGAHLRSTLAQGDQPGGALLILDGGYSEVTGGINSKNNYGGSFHDWGLGLNAQINSPTGAGEQLYIIASGALPLNQDFGATPVRRYVGGGVILPVTSWGLQVNPEFTVSDTNPASAYVVLATRDHLYSGALTWTAPVPIGEPGSTTARFSTKLLDEHLSLPAFNTVLAHDRLTTLEAGLSWNGASQATLTGLHAEFTFTKGVSWLGARAQSDGSSSNLTSRGASPDFTKMEIRLGATQTLPLGAIMNVTLRGQTSFHGVLPSSETFDLSGRDGLSSYTQGALVSDGGATERVQLERQWARRFGRLGVAATPYAFVSEGEALPAVSDLVSPRSALDYGVGLRLDGSGLSGINAPSVALEYGHAEPDRGPAPGEYLQVTLGAQF